MPKPRSQARSSAPGVMSLKELRKFKGMTLNEVRKKIEKRTGLKLRRSDVRDIEKKLSLLKLSAFVEALGGRLEVHAPTTDSSSTLSHNRKIPSVSSKRVQSV